MNSVSPNGNGQHLRSYLPFPLEMESCACAICSRTDAKTLLTIDSFGFPTRTVECKQCGLVYVNPRPTKPYMENFYRKWFRFFYEGRRKVDEEYIRDKSWKEWDASRVRRYSAHLSGKKSVLDIGCGAGYFAAQVQQENPDCTVVGIEPDSMMARHASEKLKLKVHEGFFETFPSTDRFDAISAFHVIEHLFDLDKFFKFLRDHLQPEGVVIIETPNVAGSWKGIGLFHIAHLYTFSLRTITNLFLLNGFEVLQVSSLENDLDDSNLYLVARMMPETKPVSLTSDPEESARVAEKCDSVGKVRAVRVLRNWAKMGYFSLRA
jgi:SAM-dependent methyltransferase